MKNIDLIKLESSENIKSLKTSQDSIISWYEKDALGNVSLKYKINNEIKDITSDIKSELSSKLTIPSGGNKNDVLTKTESGFKWTSQSEVQSNLSGDEKTIQISGDVISVKTIEENQVSGLIDDLNSKQDKISESNNLDYSLISGEPTSLSAFTNDPNYQTLDNVSSLISGKADKDDLNSKQDKISETNKLDYKFISGEPTSLSAFTNDPNYQTLDNVSSLISGKAESSYVNEKLDEINTTITSSLINIVKFKGIKTNVSELTTDTEEAGSLYLIRNKSGDVKNIYDEYVCVEKEGVKSFELLGSFDSEIFDKLNQDITNKSDITYVDTELAKKQNIISKENRLGYDLLSGTPKNVVTGEKSAMTIWSGSKDEYDSINKDLNTIYIVEDDENLKISIDDVLNLNSELNSKQDKISETNRLSYELISGAPTNLSAFTNDLNYQTLENVKDLISGKAEADDIPTVNDSKITITQGGVEKGSFTLNQSVSGSIDIDSVDLTNYLTFTAEEARSTIALSGVGNPDPVTLEYKINDSAWSLYTINDMITLTNKGDKVRFRAGINKNQRFAKDFNNNYHKFVMTGRIAASGSINTLLDRNDNIDDLIRRSYCYWSMFRGCTSLTSAPELPATTLAGVCYAYMFYGCTSLTTAPELPATILDHHCYEYMFYGCTSLASAPKLPAITLTDYCYCSMFQGCSSLTTAPDLPATKLANWCCSKMFEGCTNLNYINIAYTGANDFNALTTWLGETPPATGYFVCPEGFPKEQIPAGWEVSHVIDSSEERAIARRVTGSKPGMILWAGTQAEYDAIVTKDPNTVYMIKETL